MEHSKWSRRKFCFEYRSINNLYRNIRNYLCITLDYQQCTMYSKYR